MREEGHVALMNVWTADCELQEYKASRLEAEVRMPARTDSRVLHVMSRFLPISHSLYLYRLHAIISYPVCGSSPLT